MISLTSGHCRVRRWAAIGLLGLSTAACAELQGLVNPPLYGQLDDGDAALAARAMQETLEASPNGVSRAWHNPRSGNGGRILPTRTYVTDSGYFCREYAETLQLGSESDTRMLTACRADDGLWLWPQAQSTALVLAALPATAADGGAFTTRAGLTVENSLGTTLKVLRVAGHRVEFRNDTGETFTSHAMLYAPNPKVIGDEGVLAAVDSLWPLAVGKTASAWVYNHDWAWQQSWRVVRRELVEVPAGTFEAWVIEHTERALGDGYEAKSETWYAPAIGWNVRYRAWTVTPATGQVDEWVLTRVVVPAPSDRRAAPAPAPASARVAVGVSDKRQPLSRSSAR